MNVFVISAMCRMVKRIVRCRVGSRTSISPLFIRRLNFTRFLKVCNVTAGMLSFLVTLLNADCLVGHFNLHFNLLFCPFYLIVTFILLFLFFVCNGPSTASLLYTAFIAVVVTGNLNCTMGDPMGRVVCVPADGSMGCGAGNFASIFNNHVTGVNKSHVASTFGRGVSSLVICNAL